MRRRGPATRGLRADSHGSRSLVCWNHNIRGEEPMDTMTVITAILLTVLLGGFVLLMIVGKKVGDDDDI